MTQIFKKEKFSKALLILFGISLFLMLLVIHGLIPFAHLNSLCSYYRISSIVDCLKDQKLSEMFVCKSFGIPFGSPLVQGAPYYIFIAVICKVFNLSAYLGLILANILLLLLAFVSMVLLLNKLGSQKYLSVFFSFIFLAMPFIYGHIGPFPATGISFLLLPFFIYFDYLILEKFSQGVPKKITIATIFLLYALIKICVMFLNGYGFMISSLASFCLFGFYSFKLLRNKSNLSRVLVMDAIFLVSLGLAYGWYQLLILGDSSFQAMPLDFFRGEGVDLITLVLPTSQQFYAVLLNIAHKYNPLAFYGDGNHIAYNYMGFLLLALFITYLFIVKNKSLFVKVLIIAGFISLFLSLGPSLKINDVKDVTAHNGPIIFQDYLMPESAATLDLHTGFIYQRIPGIKIMRAVYRWLLLFKFIVIVGAALFLSHFKNKKFILPTLILLLLILVEQLPNVKQSNKVYSRYYSQLQTFDQGILADFRKYIKPNEKIFYLSQDNDFLADYITAKTKAKSYNLAGDKDIALASEYWPDPIKKLRNYQNVNDNAYAAFSQGLIDKMIVPYFNLRWNSYSWPPKDDTVEKVKSERLAVFNRNDSRFIYHDEYYFGIVELNKGDSN